MVFNTLLLKETVNITNIIGSFFSVERQADIYQSYSVSQSAEGLLYISSTARVFFIIWCLRYEKFEPMSSNFLLPIPTTLEKNGWKIEDDEKTQKACEPI